MIATEPGDRYAGQVADRARVASFAADIVGAAQPFAVVDERGAVVGRIEPKTVIDLLAGREAG
jgi:hypothetical protein